MSRRWLLVASLALGAAATVPANAWAEEPSRQMQADTVTARARVTRVDVPARTVTLTDRQGNSFDMQVGPNIDMSSLKVGSTVQATYTESLGVAIRGPNEAPPPGATERMVERPGTTVRQTTASARISSVDYKNNMVTFDLPSGGSRTVHVKDPAVQARLTQLKPGNTVSITYTQASALSIRPAS